MKSVRDMGIIAYRNGIHYDKSLEDAVIGICLLEASAHFKFMPLLESDLFYQQDCKVIFDAISSMYSAGHQIDLLTITHYLRTKGVLEIESLPVSYALVKKCENVVSSGHIETWCVILRELYAERKMLEIRATAGEQEGDAIDNALRIKSMIEKVLSVKSTDDWHDMSQVMISLSQHRELVKGKEMLGIATGFNTFDRITAGLQPTQMVVLGARPSVGKTAFIGAIANNIAKQGYSVGIISLEMPEEQIGGRLASIYSDIEFWRIYRNRHADAMEERRLMEAMSDMAGLPIHISTKTDVNASAIRSKAEKLKKRKGLDVLIIDYLQLIEGEGKEGNREREVAKLSRALKLMAMDLKICVIVLCQLNRESEKMGVGKKPKMSQIRESGAIEQDADIVMMLHRDWKIGVIADENGNSTERQAHIIVEKNRNGETMEIKIGFDPWTMRFYEDQSHSPFPENPNSHSIKNFKEPKKSDDLPF